MLLHRLCKNDITHREYILFTHQFIEENEDADQDVTLEYENGVNDYDSIGLVNYKFVSLKSLYDEVPEPPPISLPEKASKPLIHEHVFDLSPLETYEYLSNFELKKLWNADVTDFEYEKGKMNRVGTKHICVFEKGSAEFESVTNDFGKDKLVYGEQLKRFPLAREFTIYFIMEPFNDQTKVRTEVHYKPFPLLDWILRPIIALNVKKINQKFISSFSNLKRFKKMEMSDAVS